MRKQISHKALHGLLALAFLITMVFGAFQFFGKLQATQAAEISITEYPIPTRDGEPYGITAGSDGNLWFTELLGNKIGRVNLAGTTPPSGKWLMPAQGFNVQEGNTITLSVQADPGGTPMYDSLTLSRSQSTGDNSERSLTASRHQAPRFPDERGDSGSPTTSLREQRRVVATCQARQS